VICFLLASAHSFNNLRVIRDADNEFENESSTDNDVIIKNEDYEIAETIDDNSGDIIDESLDNIEINCHKCRKASFSFRKVNFCEKCIEQGMFSETDAYPENCKKCTKPKYHIKHKNYCEIKCNTIMDEQLQEDSTTTTTTSAPDLGPLGNLYKFLVGATTF